MKRFISVAILHTGLCVGSLTGQGSTNLSGRYVDEKQKMTIEVYASGTGYEAKQVEAPEAKGKTNNGKLIAKDMVVNGEKIVGTVISTTNGKEYQASWTLLKDRKSLALKVKWGFLSFNDTWSKL